MNRIARRPAECIGTTVRAVCKVFRLSSEMDAADETAHPHAFLAIAEFGPVPPLTRIDRAAIAPETVQCGACMLQWCNDRYLVFS